MIDFIAGEIMKYKGPYVTLVIGAAVAVILLSVNTITAAKTTAQNPSIPEAGGISDPAPAAAPTPALTSAAPTVGVVGTAGGQPTKRTGKFSYAGATTTEPGTSVAVVINGGRAIAYLCTGSVEVWLQGTVVGNKVSLKNTKGATLTATYANDTVDGSVNAADGAWKFKVKKVTKPSGLYRASLYVRGARVVGGWIVLPDGSQVGATSTNGITTGPAAEIDPATGGSTVDGTPVTAFEVDGLTLS